jgi:hypothetical protein
MSSMRNMSYMRNQSLMKSYSTHRFLFHSM